MVGSGRTQGGWTVSTLKGERRGRGRKQGEWAVSTLKGEGRGRGSKQGGVDSVNSLDVGG